MREDLCFSFLSHDITKLSLTKQCEKALALLEEMRSTSFEPNLISLSAVVSACENCRALTPDEISYNAVISACEKGKQWEETLRLLQQMTCRALSPDEISYSASF